MSEEEHSIWDDSVVIPHQPPIAVYWNPAGALVISQQDRQANDEKQFVFLLPENIDLLIAALTEMRDQARRGRQ